MHTVHPSLEAIRLATSRIQGAVDAHGGDREVVMDWGIVHREGCRTLACHAGWYALGRLMDQSAVRGTLCTIYQEVNSLRFPAVIDTQPDSINVQSPQARACRRVHVCSEGLERLEGAQESGLPTMWQ